MRPRAGPSGRGPAGVAALDGDRLAGESKTHGASSPRSSRAVPSRSTTPRVTAANRVTSAGVPLETRDVRATGGPDAGGGLRGQGARAVSSSSAAACGTSVHRSAAGREPAGAAQASLGG
jgi:hypothetical protein